MDEKAQAKLEYAESQKAIAGYWEQEFQRRSVLGIDLDGDTLEHLESSDDNDDGNDDGGGGEGNDYRKLTQGGIVKTSCGRSLAKDDHERDHIAEKLEGKQANIPLMEGGAAQDVGMPKDLEKMKSLQTEAIDLILGNDTSYSSDDGETTTERDKSTDSSTMKKKKSPPASVPGVSYVVSTNHPSINSGGKDGEAPGKSEAVQGGKQHQQQCSSNEDDPAAMCTTTTTATTKTTDKVEEENLDKVLSATMPYLQQGNQISTAVSVPGAMRNHGPDFNGVSEDFLIDAEIGGGSSTPSHGMDDGNHQHSLPGDRNILTGGLADEEPLPAIEAKMVEETILTYAEKDKSGQKLRFMWIGIFVIVVIFVVTLSVVLTRNEDESDDGIDPRCKKPNQTVAEHCLCYNTTARIWETLTMSERTHFYDKLEYLRGVGGVTPDFQIEPEECTPEAQALVQMILLARLEGIDPEDDEAHKTLLPIVPEGYAILMFYFRMGGLDWRIQAGWLSSDVSLHDYFGVDIFFLGAITTVELPNNNLVGSIPSEIKFLNSLRHLDLSGNPGLVGTIPAELTTLTNLNTLSIANTGLQGTLPDSLRKLDQLDSVDFHGSDLTGTIPDGLFTPQLRFLDLSVNKFRGTIPPSISNSNRLQSLQLQANQLTGTFPDSLGFLAELAELNVGVNQFEGGVPPFLAYMDRLNFASFMDSGFQGVVPESYCETIPTPPPPETSVIVPPRQRRLVVWCFKEGQAIAPTCSCCANPLAVIILCAEAFPPEIVQRFVDNDL